MPSTMKNTTEPYAVGKGRAHPLGATPDGQGVNFSLLSTNATSVQLLIFDKHDDLEPVQTINLDPRENRDFYVWHCYVRGLAAGAHYAYRVDGSRDEQDGHRFNPNKVLIDPYARGNTDYLWDRAAACGPEDNLHKSMRSVVIDMANYDWEGDQPLNRPMRESIIYEMSVGGFTRSESANVSHPGTFAGVIEKIPYLKDLGITAVELLPVFEFDDKEILRITQDNRILKNFWGYSTIGFFAPDAQFCLHPSAGSHVREFRDMVKALHKAGIEVILDVVFNHTNEGNHQGPLISFKGIDNQVYYHQVPDNRYYYMDYSGCGNTVNCNHPVVERFILDCLEFWVREMHVDGFRFDEGSILSRGEDGRPLEHPPVLWAIELSETLADTKIIAEAWDAAGLYQIGYFPGFRWAEWNGRYRDTIRAFVAGRPGIIGDVAQRLAGSSDLYEARGRLPVSSINFITCHDGFTLNDLVSYNGKHNQANGEDNRDGANDNISWNCGQEGPSDNLELETFRSRQVKNFAAILLLSKGVPMLLGGDEMRRTQGGNNNAYCQDNEISWYDWSLLEKHRDVHRFFRKMIAFRKDRPVLERRDFFGSEINERGFPQVSWHGCALNSPGWNDPASRVLAATVGGAGEQEDLHIILNMDEKNLDFQLPEMDERKWYKLVDTAQQSPRDFVDPGKETLCPGPEIHVIGRSVVILVSR
jgi:glycogen operon protein